MVFTEGSGKKNHAGTDLNRAFLRDLALKCGGLAEKFGLGEKPDQSLAGFLRGIEAFVPEKCPVCGAGVERVKPIARFPHRTYRACKNCGMIFMSRLTQPPIEYEKEYFFEFYKKQYGKTYLEDFPNLIRMAKNRLKYIEKLLRYRPAAEKKDLARAADSGGPAILDIGCAYGPFLAAAKADGFSCSGIDPAGDAVHYVQHELGINAWRGFFPESAPPALLKDGGFDAVTMWYVIEHFTGPGEVLEAIRRILKKGGVLAFSTPSFKGISGRKSLKKFLAASPSDHYTVWAPGYCKAALKKYGFSVKKTVVSGCHPERFPLFGPLLSGKKGIVYRLLMLIGRIFALGDTFEIYAVKREELYYG
jgi:2-polyprenyl-3-methyl-5-hydroxy-6-metoxy-1,4-benzoquinol methylase